MKKLLCLLLCAAVMVSIFAGCAPSDVLLDAPADTKDTTGETAGSTDVTAGSNTDETTQTEPPVTEPPVTEPPVTEPPVTEPPVTEPPVTEPPVTEPPVVTPQPVPEPETSFMVGFGRVNITPTGPVPLAGLAIANRVSNEVLDQLYATCVAFTDKDGNTILLYHLDLLSAYDYVMSMRWYISQKTGVPKDNIIIAATHNHSAPSFVTGGTEYIHTYREVLFLQWMAQAAEAAMADRKSAEMYIASTRGENLAYVRHYVREDGSIHAWGGNATDVYVGHTTEVDDEIQLVKFVREGGKDVLLMNWQGHPRGQSDTDELYTGINLKNAILSDVDVIRKKVEAELDCYMAFFLGASGNVNSSGRIPSEVFTYEYVSHNLAVAQCVIDAAGSFQAAQTGYLQLITQTVPLSRKEDYTIHDMPITAFAIGDLGFVVAGYEMFCENGMDIKNSSSFKMTFVVTCANGDHKYIPSIKTFEYGGYEVGATRYVAGSAEKLARAFITMLDQMRDSQ